MVNVYEIRPGSYATVAEAKEGGSGDVSKEYVDAGLAEKQDKLIAGANITIVENVISASGELASTEWGEIGGSLSNQTDLKNALDAKASATDVAGLTTRVGNVESDVAGLDASKATKTEVATGLAGKQDVLTAGQNITIENNVISADTAGVTDATITRENGAYGQATKLTVVDGGTSTNTTLFERLEQYDANWGGATPHFYGTDFINDHFVNKTELADELADKQDVLTAGDNITIENNVISATGGGVDTSCIEIWTYSRSSSSRGFSKDEVTYTPAQFFTYVKENYPVKNIRVVAGGRIIDVSNISDTAITFSGAVGGILPDNRQLLVYSNIDPVYQTGELQPQLVSGTNIKTINNESILGSGNITVSGEAPSNMVTTDTKQTITNQKTLDASGSTNTNRFAPVVFSGYGRWNGTYPQNDIAVVFKTIAGDNVHIGCVSPQADITDPQNAPLRTLLSFGAGDNYYSMTLGDSSYPTLEYSYTPNTQTWTLRDRAVPAISDSSTSLMNTKWVKSLMPESTITGDGTATSFTVTHSLGKMPGIVQVTGSNGVVVKDSEVTITKTANDVTVVFNTAPAADTTYTVAMLY